MSKLVFFIISREIHIVLSFLLLDSELDQIEPSYVSSNQEDQRKKKDLREFITLLI